MAGEIIRLGDSTSQGHIALKGSPVDISVAKRISYIGHKVQYAIAPARLVPRGVANLTPVSSNDSEEGRAKNRRVEMVVR